MSLPKAIDERITYVLNLTGTWAGAAASIGLDPLEVADLATLVTSAQSKRTVSVGARTAATAATLDQNSAMEAMTDKAMNLIKKIRVFAETAADPDAVFVAAEISPPTPGSPLPAPGIPENPTGLVNNNGHIEVKWDAELRGRMFFRVERQTVPTGQPANEWQFVGGVTEKEYMDTNVPTNATSVLYRIAAVRNSEVSQFSDPVTVMLATPGAMAA